MNECNEDKMEDFKRRMRDWMLKIMSEIDDSKEIKN
jgi:hypothetical protein